MCKWGVQPLFDILRGDSDPSSPRELTPAAKQALQLVNKVIQNTQVYCIDPSLPLILIICPTKPLPTRIIWQKPGPIEWLHLHNSASKVLNPYDLTDGAERTNENPATFIAFKGPTFSLLCELFATY